MRYLLTVLSLHFIVLCQAQQSSEQFDLTALSPEKYLAAVEKKAKFLEERVNLKIEKFLENIIEEEKKLKKKLFQKNKAASEELFGDINSRYDQIKKQLQKTKKLNSLSGYIPYLDSLQSSVRFLEQVGKLLTPGQLKILQSSKQSLSNLEVSLAKAHKVQEIIRNKQQLIREQFQKYGLNKAFTKYSNQYYYYRQQLQDYKEVLKDPQKIEQRALSLLQQLPAFKDFMRKNSQLASLIRFPEEYGTIQNLQGLQSRTEVMQLVQQKIDIGGAGSLSFVQQGMQQAQSQINQLKSKVNQLGGSDSEIEMPDFKPNSQKTKSFSKRLEIGSNLQSTKANNFFPITTDLGISLGYKLNDKSIIGLGASYKIGWGKDIRNIVVTGEGVGVRSFLEYKVKWKISLTGGFEYNFQEPFNILQPMNDLKNFNDWQSSGLLGITKVIPAKGKYLKKTKVQLLWDFLSYQQYPRSESFKFRVGYFLK